MIAVKMFNNMKLGKTKMILLQLQNTRITITNLFHWPISQFCRVYLFDRKVPECFTKHRSSDILNKNLLLARNAVKEG